VKINFPTTWIFSWNIWEWIQIDKFIVCFIFYEKELKILKVNESLRQLLFIGENETLSETKRSLKLR
jgi:hypothetical protein